MRVIGLQKNQHLLAKVSKVKHFVKNIVFEFYANLVIDISNPTPKVFYKVFVRGHMLDFPSVVINEYFDSQRSIVDFMSDYDIIIV